jgi:hypothetical protein
LGSAIVWVATSAGSEGTGILVNISARVILVKMIHNHLTILEGFARLGRDETTMVERTECIIFMLCLADMLQPLVFSNKCPGLESAGIVGTLLRARCGMFCGVVAFEVMLVSEWLFIAAVNFGA